MVDTSRTVSDLTTNLFQDGQASGSITPQDLRDFIKTSQTKQGSMYVSSPASTTISVGGTFVEGAGTFTLSTVPTSNEFDMNTNARLRYTGTPTINVTCFAHISLEIDTAAIDKELAIYIAKNGTEIVGSQVVGMSPATTVNSVQLSTTAVASLATNDYLSVWVANNDSTDNITMRKAQIVALGSVT